MGSRMPVEGRRAQPLERIGASKGDVAQDKSPHSDTRSADFRVGRLFVPAGYSPA
jgi:hypothetical protein